MHADTSVACLDAMLASYALMEHRMDSLVLESTLMY